MRTDMQNARKRLFAFAQQSRHNPWLDLLRTVAIGLVLLNAMSVLLDAIGQGAFRHG